MYKSLFAASVRRPFLTSAIFAAVLALAAVFELKSPELPDRAQWAAANLSTGSNVIRLPYEPPSEVADSADSIHVVPSEPSIRQAMALADVVGRAREWLSASPDRRDEDVRVGTSAVEEESVLETAASEPSIVIVPEVELTFVDAPPVVLPEADKPDVTAMAPASRSPPPLDPIDRDLLVAKGEEMLARGDVGGARLFFQRAADRGDARGAIGMARTFDPKVLATLRVYGVRPDPDQAAHWYGRAKTAEAVASTR